MGHNWSVLVLAIPVPFFEIFFDFQFFWNFDFFRFGESSDSISTLMSHRFQNRMNLSFIDFSKGSTVAHSLW